MIRDIPIVASAERSTSLGAVRHGRLLVARAKATRGGAAWI
jgi:hypothetical protein